MTDVLPPAAAGNALNRVVPEPDEPRYSFGIPYGWFQVAWSHELEPGSVVPRYYFGRHLVLWRDEDGEAHLNDAFCPHLGGHFGYGGKVVGRCRLQCPFHGWEFDADGRNTRIPYSDRVNNKATVRSYPVREIANHLIMAWYHPYDEPPLFELEVPPEAENDGYTDWTDVHFSIAAASQELAENSVDGPHSATCTTPRSCP